MSDYTNHTVTIVIADQGNDSLGVTMKFDPDVEPGTQMTPALHIAMQITKLICEAANVDITKASEEETSE